MPTTDHNNSIDNPHVREELSDYLDGLLPADRQEAVQAHLSTCPECRAEFMELRATQRLMQTMPIVAAPRSFALTPEMAGTVRKPSFWERFLVPQNTPRLATGSVVALLLLFFVFVTSNLSPMQNQTFLKIGSGLGGSQPNSAQAQPPGDFSSKSAAPLATNTTAAAGSDNSSSGATTDAAEVPTSSPGVVNLLPAPAPTPAAPATGGFGGEVTTSTAPSDVAPSSPLSTDNTITNDRIAAAPHQPSENSAQAVPSTDNRTGWVVLQIGLLSLALAFGAAAFVSRRKT
jgi:anti-sigma factor RsiW